MERSQMDEQILYSAREVTVTKSRMIVKGDTYQLANITSCKVREQREQNWDLFAYLLLFSLVVGVFIGTAASDDPSSMFFSDNRFQLCCIGFFFSAIFATIMYFSSFQRVQWKYTLIVGTSSGEIEAIQDSNKEFIYGIYEAVNNAMVLRG
jgi:hypothetical protein